MLSATKPVRCIRGRRFLVIDGNENIGVAKRRAKAYRQEGYLAEVREDPAGMHGGMGLGAGHHRWWNIWGHHPEFGKCKRSG